MSVVIRGMGIPKTCGDCPCYEIEEGFCKVTYDDVSCLQISKQGNCPLIELPPHGRLIDADALKDTLDYYIREAGWSDEINEALTWVRDEFIDHEPTIIEAEEGE